MEPNRCLCKLQDIPQPLQDVLRMSQDGSETLPNVTNTASKGVVETYKFEAGSDTLPNATNTVSNAHKTPSTRVVEVYRFEA